MGVLSLVELLKGTSDPVQQQVALDIITADQITGYLPFAPIPGDVVTFPREKALPVTSTPSSGATITEDNSFEQSRVTAYARRFLVDQPIDYLDAAAGGGMDRVRGLAIQAAIKSMTRKYGDAIITGNAGWTVTVNSTPAGVTSTAITIGPGHDPRLGPGIIRYTHSGTTVAYKAPGDAEFGAAVSISNGVTIYADSKDKWVTLGYADAPSASGDFVFSFAPTASSVNLDGALRLVSSAQTIASTGNNGDAISLAALDQLADQVTDSSGERVYIMHRRTRRAVMALLRAAGGVPMAELIAPMFGTGLEMDGKVPTYNGIKILCTDWLPTNRSKGLSSNCTVVLCATISELGGLSGFYSTAGEASEGKILLTGPNGLVVESLGPQETRDATKVRSKAYWGLKNASEKGLAMLDSITN